ncbi:hypothetical protein MMC25_002915 [Agyrium rufum]|nr:hypothetical protein [Agyrium rufum]
MNEVERKSYQRPIDNLTDFRKVAKPMDPPFFVWEPVPDSCVKSELQNVKAALKLVDVFSPNHLELAALFGEEERNIFLKSELEMLRAQCNELLTDGFGKKPSAVVVRRGDLGCYVATDIRHSWYPAYYSKEVLGFQASDNVKDPTGGGNAFLGAYCIGLITDHGEGQCQFEMAAHYGSVAASFAIQQHGVPHLTHLADREYWNKDSVQERLSKCIKAGYSPPMRMEKVEPTEPYTSEGFDMNGIKYSRIVRK